MFEKDSPQDLLLRGFSREYILDKTGTDVGYHGNAMKKELKGVDRVAYKVEFVKSNYTNDEIVAVLDEYAAGIDAATVLDRLGLAGVNIIKLNVLFKGLGLSDEFKDADKKHRKGIMKQGMLDKYGVDNPFKLDSFQQIAAETRKEKYGAEYTLASGSALSDGARATFVEHTQKSIANKVAANANVDVEANKSVIDYEREYSRLLYHYIPDNVDVSNMRLSWRSLSAVVKDAQRKVFYKRELELWNENPLRKGKWGTVQAFLYANRYKYLNKLPHELTDRMLLRAFRISGLHMGYTSFNSSLMRQVIEKYNVKSVYDPCAGWGERMMTCGKLGVSYEGCDINSELFEGYKKLYELIDGFKPVLHNNDSANQLVTGDADAIITCPPYKGIEVYSDNGAENLSDEDFAAWWGEVVKNCSYSNAKVFAVQTNQACRKVFEDALVAQGWQLKEELVFDNNQKSHFHRSNGNDKHEYESMLVFTR